MTGSRQFRLHQRPCHVLLYQRFGHQLCASPMPLLRLSLRSMLVFHGGLAVVERRRKEGICDTSSRTMSLVRLRHRSTPWARSRPKPHPGQPLTPWAAEAIEREKLRIVVECAPAHKPVTLVAASSCIEIQKPSTPLRGVALTQIPASIDEWNVTQVVLFGHLPRLPAAWIRIRSRNNGGGGSTSTVCRPVEQRSTWER